MDTGFSRIELTGPAGTGGGISGRPEKSANNLRSRLVWLPIGLIAGGGVRAVVEAAGIRDVLAKSLGSSNHANVVKATMEALLALRQRQDILKLRGKDGSH